MTEIQILDDVTVKLISSMGSDQSVVQAARVSVQGENEKTYFGSDTAEQAKKDEGLINYLIREKHGSPFEHNSMTFFVKAPIFVFREFHRHRIGFSYNEMSGRYTKLEPEFYVPKETRPLVNIGSSAKPEFAPGTPEQTMILRAFTVDSYARAWDSYERMLNAGISNEVARAVLPVGIFSQMYVTTNARALMNFLSLRTREENAAFVSRPQEEIQMVARKMEESFAALFPITHQKYNEHGRVAP